MFVFMYVLAYVCMCVGVYVGILYVCMSVGVYVCMYLFICVCV